MNSLKDFIIRILDLNQKEMPLIRKSVMTRLVLPAVFCLTTSILAQNANPDSSLDVRVRKYLNEQEGQWHNLNVYFQNFRNTYNFK
jgi:hypothetical protein